MNQKKKPRTPNKLINEKSPYLLQHAYNPVDWFPWGEEAFEKARKENKPVFLSIGYSTCHWCHVMEKESFEDESVAQLLNSTFVCIKVDREERPDIDQTYMIAAQVMTGHGGWPLTIIMTPDKRPFFAATYIPKKSMYGRIGLVDLIKEIERIWKEEPEKVMEVANRVSSILRSAVQTSSREERYDLSELLELSIHALESHYDEVHAGFGTAPKFPASHKLLLLLRAWLRKREEKYLRMVERTLQRMRNGGIFDQVGFGFHRYSTDREWRLPHFEKMLYDQAMLLLAYSEAFAATKKEFYRIVCVEILEYLKDQLLSPEGAFFSAEDADSEGEEGKFYTWTFQELSRALTAEELEFAIVAFDVKEEGNFKEEASGEVTGRNVLVRARTWEEISEELGKVRDETVQKWKQIRSKLFEIRQNRVRPRKDDKVLADWNGLTIAALANAGKILFDGAFLKHAKDAAEFILRTMVTDDFQVFHRYRDGQVAIEGFLDDYAFLTWGLLELFEATQESRYLFYATRLTEKMIQKFGDSENGGFFFTTRSQARDVLFRNKEFFDAAIPSGNSIAVLCLLKLSRITGNVEYERFAEKTLSALADLIQRAPQGFAMLMLGADFLMGPSFEVIVLARNKGKKLMQVFEKVHSVFQPRKVTIFKIESEDNEMLQNLVPYLQSYALEGEELEIFVCRNYSCEAPTSDIAKALELLTQTN